MGRRRALRALALLLVLLGGWQLGEGGYIQAKALLAQYLLRSAWDEALAGDRKVKPWPWADTWPVARLRMPRRGVDLIVLAGASGRTLAFGPGHLDGTPLPGATGNSVISGHRDTHFRFLQRLRSGDELTIQGRDGRTRRFRVAGARIVDARRATLVSEPGRHLLTLVTCYPFDAVVPGGPLRYLVLAQEETPAGATVRHGQSGLPGGTESPWRPIL